MLNKLKDAPPKKITALCWRNVALEGTEATLPLHIADFEMTVPSHSKQIKWLLRMTGIGMLYFLLHIQQNYEDIGIMYVNMETKTCLT